MFKDLTVYIVRETDAQGIFTDRLPRVTIRRAPSPPHVWLCLCQRSAFACLPSHYTTPQTSCCPGQLASGEKLKNKQIRLK